MREMQRKDGVDFPFRISKKRRSQRIRWSTLAEQKASVARGKLASDDVDDDDDENRTSPKAHSSKRLTILQATGSDAKAA